MVYTIFCCKTVSYILEVFLHNYNNYSKSLMHNGVKRMLDTFFITKGSFISGSFTGV